MTHPKLWRLSLLLVIVFLTAPSCYSQSTITATFSLQGSVNYRITGSGNYVYISQEGNVTGYGAIGNGNISYDFKGRVDKIGTTAVSYDYKGRIDGLGTTSITYDLKGRVDKVGNYSITYDLKGRLDKIGDLNITYDFKDRVDKISNASISYDYKGRVDKIDDSEGMITLGPEMIRDHQ